MYLISEHDLFRMTAKSSIVPCICHGDNLSLRRVTVHLVSWTDTIAISADHMLILPMGLAMVYVLGFLYDTIWKHSTSYDNFPKTQPETQCRRRHRRLLFNLHSVSVDFKALQIRFESWSEFYGAIDYCLGHYSCQCRVFISPPTSKLFSKHNRVMYY